MQFGVHLTWPCAGSTTTDIARRKDELLAFVHEARDLGYHYAILGEHYLTAPFQQLHPWPLLARLIPESGDMRLICTLIAPLHNPVMLAEVLGSIDVLSEGRLGVAFGLGYKDEEYLAFGVERRERVALQREVVETLLHLWGGESVTQTGHGFALENADVTLKTAQRPHPPVWIAASADVAIKRAAGWELPWYTDAFSDVSDLERQIQMYAHLRRSDSGPHDVHVMRECYCAATREMAVETAFPYLHEMWRVYGTWDLARSLGREESFADNMQQLARDRFVVGSPEDCIREMQRYEKLGVSSANLRMYWPGMDPEDAMRSLRLFAREVMPNFELSS